MWNIGSKEVQQEEEREGRRRKAGRDSKVYSKFIVVLTA